MKELTFLTINSKRLINNLKSIKKIVKNSKVWAVIKSDAYGHGIKNIIKYLKNSDGFAVSEIDDAILIRKYFSNKPILLLRGFFYKEDIDLIINYNLTTVIHSFYQFDIFKKYKFKNNKSINIYVKFNSGMNRLGFSENEIIKIWNLLKINKNINKLTLMSHFSSYDNDLINNQIKLINKIYKLINYKCDLSIASSYTIINNINTHKDWVRPGIILYGLLPFYDKINEDYLNKLNIKQILSLYSKIISIKKIKKNSYIGYGKNFINKKEILLGIIPCGYYEGYPNNLNIKNKIPVWIKDKKTEIIGKISMNMMAINLTNINNVNIGDLVELWGDNIKINYLSNLLNLTSYNIITSLSKGVKTFIINK